MHRNYFSSPYEAFAERTLWSLENAFTESFKELFPIRQFEVTAKLVRFVQPLVTDVLPPAPVPQTAQVARVAGGES